MSGSARSRQPTPRRVRLYDCHQAQPCRGYNHRDAAALQCAAYDLSAAGAKKQRKWLIDYARKMRLSFDKSQSVYRRDTSFDEAIELLYPDHGEELSSAFGTDLMDDDAS